MLQHYLQRKVKRQLSAVSSKESLLVMFLFHYVAEMDSKSDKIASKPLCVYFVASLPSSFIFSAKVGFPTTQQFSSLVAAIFFFKKAF